MLSGQDWMPSISGRHNDDRLRKESGIFRKATDVFFRSEYGEVHADIARCTPVILIWNTVNMTVTENKYPIL